MGQAEGKSMLYLEARCLYVTKAAGVQGTQNGSVSCIGIPAAVPSGIRAVVAENLIASMLDLECASSNDQTFTHSDLRRSVRTLMQFAPGTDFINSGYSATPNYEILDSVKRNAACNQFSGFGRHFCLYRKKHQHRVKYAQIL